MSEPTAVEAAGAQPVDDTRFELKFRVDLRDCNALSQHVRWTALERVNALLPALAAGVIGAFIGAWVWVWDAGRFPIETDVDEVLKWMFVAGLAAFFFFLLVVEPARRRSIIKGRTISMGESVLVAEAHGVVVTSAGITTAFPWSCVKLVGESSGHIFFMYSRLEGLVVPKRVFDAPEQVQRFVNFVRSKVPAAAG